MLPENQVCYLSARCSLIHGVLYGNSQATQICTRETFCTRCFNFTFLEKGVGVGVLLPPG